ncbi:ragulator complex protein LAMTOR1 isoform X1 [Erinaceus europaeus]|uniref:Ragulator complex protein LAMTOR1 n=1 Tax=Erinaceus europaeus TaxID=9365 RepID=A0ABM3W8J2_ERIEU|nr:ragulator complex protein LAMTOR1 isoform X1 [Erinaceus europaeus]
MGCCYSSENEDSDQDQEERKLLLPSSPPTKALNGAEPNYHSLPSARTDEQALLSSILAKTASNIIDVSAADSQGMEQHEYMDRARQYSTRLAVLSSSLTHWKKLPPLPSLTSQPHQVLASEPIPFSDLQQDVLSHPMPCSPWCAGPGLQDSRVRLQCTFSDPRGRKRGAGCTVWDPVKRGGPAWTALLLSPRLPLPPLAPSLTTASAVP